MPPRTRLEVSGRLSGRLGRRPSMIYKLSLYVRPGWGWGCAYMRTQHVVKMCARKRVPAKLDVLVRSRAHTLTSQQAAPAVYLTHTGIWPELERGRCGGGGDGDDARNSSPGEESVIHQLWPRRCRCPKNGRWGAHPFCVFSAVLAQYECFVTICASARALEATAESIFIYA